MDGDRKVLCSCHDPQRRLVFDFLKHRKIYGLRRLKKLSHFFPSNFRAYQNDEQAYVFPAHAHAQRVCHCRPPFLKHLTRRPCIWVQVEVLCPGGYFSPQSLCKLAISEKVQACLCMKPTQGAGSLVGPPLTFQLVSGPNSVLNHMPTEEFTFRRSPRFPDKCFEVVVGCTYKLAIVSRGCCVLAFFLKFPSKFTWGARSQNYAPGFLPQMCVLS